MGVDSIHDTLIFITTTAIGYVQYKNIPGFNPGFNTENILNINPQGNQPDAMPEEPSEMPEVTVPVPLADCHRGWECLGRHDEIRQWSRDSALVLTNHVDENYLPLHGYTLLAGGNFIARPTTSQAINEVIVNEQVLKRFNIAKGDPEKAIGEEITFSNFSYTDAR
ncbi:MAG: hypothetical protein IPO07_21780 [Haliscomenobacter sp.]|nr:hypothetical protein [Haliscomenobacter sp.]MBK9491124.1 hypothetical protein [Haliscomenobacter sp.]